MRVARICKTYRFEAAHRLPNVPRRHKCSRTHGHSYVVDVILHGEIDRESGMVQDYAEIDEAMVGILKQLDHRVLNDVEGLSNPTAENIAAWIWGNLFRTLDILDEVVVHETAKTWATYSGPGESRETLRVLLRSRDAIMGMLAKALEDAKGDTP